MRWFLRGAGLGAAVGTLEFALQHRTASASVACALGCLVIFIAECA